MKHASSHDFEPEDYLRVLDLRRRRRVAMLLSGLILGTAVAIGVTALLSLDTPATMPSAEVTSTIEAIAPIETTPASEAIPAIETTPALEAKPIHEATPTIELTPTLEATPAAETAPAVEATPELE
ncbi:MAG: hypothetical protein DIU78_001810 [Pseudomonadota bacterium]